MKERNITVSYKDKHYQSKENSLTNLFNIYRGTESFRADKLPAQLQRSLFFNEDDDTITLESKVLTFDLVDEDTPKLEQISEGKVVFNKTTKEIEEGFKLFDGYYIRHIKDSTLADLLMFIESLLKNKNEYVYNFVLDLHNHTKENYHSGNNLLKNIYDVALYSTEGFEKIAKVNPRFIYQNILKEDFKLNNEGKLNKVVELPKFAINYMKKNKLENCLGAFQDINATDGNNLRILFEFFDNTKVFVKSKDRPKVYLRFTEKVNKVASTYKYRIKDLLAYLVKQSFYYSKSGIFHFPMDEVILLEDYLDMCKRHDLKYEKYPFLQKEHNITMKNIKVLDNPERDAAFIDVVKKYEYICVENDDYIIRTPKNIKDMVLEGNHLHHCVSEYVSKVIDGESRILFLRKKDKPNVPFVTIDLDGDNNLVHTRGMFNEEPEEEEMKYIKRWVNSLAKKGIKKTA